MLSRDTRLSLLYQQAMLGKKEILKVFLAATIQVNHSGAVPTSLSIWFVYPDGRVPSRTILALPLLYKYVKEALSNQKPDKFTRD